MPVEECEDLQNWCDRFVEIRSKWVLAIPTVSAFSMIRGEPIRV